ncbi:hypothetical protein E2C01_088741 [Portunus trituberculatus]|uniref:Uncharacterized protein n=1 Tax=Portunus trituberculatus TaxID=210409 RepID=A0A5B7JK81_PORTR|nr:hypothetical protein [Portunus trituberculatus]
MSAFQIVKPVEVPPPPRCRRDDPGPCGGGRKGGFRVAPSRHTSKHTPPPTTEREEWLAPRPSH